MNDPSALPAGRFLSPLREFRVCPDPDVQPARMELMPAEPMLMSTSHSPRTGD
jgi:hypothetical protein